jgi:hypothetical protein
MSLSNYAENLLMQELETLLDAGTYVALSTTDPTEDGSGITEPDSGDAYARQPIGAITLAGSVIDNDADITFDTATGDWGEISHLAIFDDLTAGNMLAYCELTSAKTVLSGDTAKILAGQLTITMD